MLRPNLAQDAPPTTINVGGIDYAVNVDYRVWIDVMRLMRNLISAPTTAEHIENNLKTLIELETAVFGEVIKQPANAVLDAICEFAAGYPSAPVGEGKSTARTYSFDWDINFIVLAIQNQYGVDLSYERKEPFHWWLFLLYFSALSGDHYILRMMDIRGYTGKDPELKRQAQRFALPRETTADEQADLDAFNALFEGSE